MGLGSRYEDWAHIDIDDLQPGKEFVIHECPLSILSVDEEWLEFTYRKHAYRLNRKWQVLGTPAIGVHNEYIAEQVRYVFHCGNIRRISFTFVPYIQDYWDMLLTTHGGVTSMIARDEMKEGMNISGLRPALDGIPMPGMDLEVCYMADDKLGLYCGQKHSDFLCVRLHEEPVHKDGVTLTLETFSTVITEWDDTEEKPVRYRLAKRLLRGGRRTVSRL